MNNLHIIFLLILAFIPLFGCQKSNNISTKIDIKSYINDFELLQENPNDQTSIKITSPNAIIDPSNNDIQIFDSLIEILNNDGQDFQIKSGNSNLNNLSNFIKVFNNVKISFLDKDDYYITTNSLNWYLNTSIIDITNPILINFDGTMIKGSNGIYDIDSSLLNIYNINLNRNIFNSDGKQEYQLEIKSDFAKWFKNENTFVFSSNKKQVESTIRFNY